MAIFEGERGSALTGCEPRDPWSAGSFFVLRWILLGCISLLEGSMREAVCGVLSAEFTVSKRARFGAVLGGTGDDTKASMLGWALSGDSSRSRREDSLLLFGVTIF